MPKPPDNLDISQNAYESLLLDEHWLSLRPSRFDNQIEKGVQLLFGENVKHEDSIDVIRQFVALIDQGITPNAIVLAAVSNSFKKYISTENKTLDDCFNLKKKQSVGHPLKHRKEKEQRGRILFLIWCIRDDAKNRGETISIESAAGQVINELNLDDNEGALAKEYSAKKIDQIFDNAKQAILETMETLARNQ